MTHDDDVLTLLRDSATDFIAAQHDTARLKGHIGQPRAVDRAQWRQMAEMGWLALALPETLGGSGMGALAAATLCDVMGRSLFPEPFIAAGVMPAVLLGVAAEGGPAQNSVVVAAEALLTGDTVLTLAWQETAGQGGDALATTWLEDGRVTGVKHFVSAVQADGVLLVSATEGVEPVWVAVPVGAHGVQVATRASADGQVCTVRLDAAPIQGEVLCRGQRAQRALQQALHAAQVGAAAQLAGMASACLERTVAYVNQRVQFGKPLSAFQTVAHRCADLWIGTQLAEATWRHAAEQLAQAEQGGVVPDALAMAVSAAKARCGDVALQVGRTAVQLHGGMGFTEEADIGLYLRAAMQYAAWLGNGTQQRRRFMAARSKVEQMDIAEAPHA